jgi:hypothetical protein
MKIRSTERGFAIVILVIIMIIVGIIGVGLVSVMGAKQKSYPFQAQSYKALMLANAGVEYAIRYGKDHLSDSPSPLATGGALRNGIAKAFGGGSFAVQYYYTATGVYPAFSLRSRGAVGNVQREVVLTGFPGFALGSGLVLSEELGGPPPDTHSKDTTIPITNLYDQNLYVKYMTLRATPHGNIDRLERVTLNGTVVYNASVVPTSPVNENLAYPAGNPNYETQGANMGICISWADPTNECTSTSITPAIVPWSGGAPFWNIVLPPGDNIMILTFKSGSVQGNYEVMLYWDFTTSYTNLKSRLFTFTAS